MNNDRFDRVIGYLESRIGPDEALRARQRAWRWRAAPRRFKQWFMDPFTAKVHYHERTRIEHRVFPYRLRITAVESLQDRLYHIRNGGTLCVPDGVHFLTSTLDLSDCRDVTIRNMQFDGRGLRERPMIRVTHEGGIDE